MHSYSPYNRHRASRSNVRNSSRYLKGNPLLANPPLPDDLRVHEGAILEVYIGEGPAILVVAPLVVFESDALAFDQPLEAFAERISEDSTRGTGLYPGDGAMVPVVGSWRSLAGALRLPSLFHRIF
jgi:hypothetical protein